VHDKSVERKKEEEKDSLLPICVRICSQQIFDFLLFTFFFSLPLLMFIHDELLERHNPGLKGEYSLVIYGMCSTRI
jgi:hypothetical protein